MAILRLHACITLPEARIILVPCIKPASAVIRPGCQRIHCCWHPATCQALALTGTGYHGHLKPIYLAHFPQGLWVSGTNIFVAGKGAQSVLHINCCIKNCTLRG
eukprot:290011-Pelagomonas_calceolata.AAC.2